MRHFLVCISFFIFSVSSYSQIKYEKESRIQANEVPPTAVQLIDSLELPRKIKWYQETRSHGTSYEAKSIHKGKRISIEFAEDGSFEDLEIRIRKEEIPQVAFENIADYLLDQYKRFKVKKIQVQYSGDFTYIVNQFDSLEAAEELQVRYEIEISAKVEGEFVIYEYLFDEQGGLIQKSQIVNALTENLEF